MSLETLTYEKSFPEVFGSIVSIGSFPAKSEVPLRMKSASSPCPTASWLSLIHISEPTRPY